jgi:hypothetical protein
LKIYAPYKQGSTGDNAEKTRFYDMVARAKWDAWAKLSKGTVARRCDACMDLITELSWNILTDHLVGYAGWAGFRFVLSQIVNSEARAAGVGCYQPAFAAGSGHSSSLPDDTLS